MSAYEKFADQTGDRVIKVMGSAQDLTVSVVSRVSEFVGRVVPQLPSLPLLDKLPTPEEIVRTSFAFAQDLVSAQKTYAEGVLKAINPITSKVISNGHSKPKGASKSTSKTAASA
jgi:hypothetical protein